MKMPRRRPRAVYEVYDADEVLGGQEGFAVAQQPSDQEVPALAAEQVASYGDREGSDVLSALPASRVLTRMLAGAGLCVATVCVIAAVAIVLLHAVSGTGSAHKRLELPPRVARGRASSLAVASVAGEGRHPRAAALVNVVHREQPAPSTPPATTRARVAISPAIEISVAPRQLSARAAMSTLEIPPHVTSSCECAPAEAEFGFER